MTTDPTWTDHIFAITLFAEDLPAARAFYQRVFGLPVHFEGETSAVFRFGGTLINILAIGQADELIRSEERRVGKECRRLCRSRWSPYH
jgi:catechol 2,3-dioxygenase-like lactoylglutathione lyase family enzyme